MSASLLISREDPGVLGTHCVCVCDRIPSSFPVHIPQHNRTKQNETGPPWFYIPG